MGLPQPNGVDLRASATDVAPFGTAEGSELASRSLVSLRNWVECRFDLEVSAIEFVRHGENTTFRVRTAKRDFALRLHRPGYQADAAIQSELAWTAALRRTTEISTPAPIAARDGEAVQSYGEGAARRRAVMFEWVTGTPLSQLDRSDLWRRLGQLMAILHEHGQTWRRPLAFTRPAWDLESFVGQEPRWGDPTGVIGRRTPEAELVIEAREMVRRRLLAFGTHPERYGLIHADMAFENVLIGDRDETFVLDFDDGGPGWFAYDLAVSLFTFDAQPGFAARRDGLIAGYRDVRPLAARCVDELPTFLMARRLATLGWTFTRAETDHAARLRDERIRQAPERCRSFLDWARSR